MTLTLEDVRNVRFPIAKRVGEGYRATEVDDFVDRVDATFGSILDENERLKAQLEALEGGAPREAQAAGEAHDALAAENERLKAELEQARNARPQAVAAPAVDGAELDRLRSENEELRQQQAELRQQLEQARQSTGLTVMDGNQDGTGRVEKIVVTTAAQASPAVTRLVQLATEQAEGVVAEARAEAERTVNEAQAQAQNLTLDATTRAERIESAARVEADRLQQEARANSDAVNADAEKRRREMFGALEAERDQLVGRVNGLREFENSYRANLVSHFQSQLEAVRSAEFEPADTPSLLTEGAASGTSATPRLDALLAEGRQQG